MDLKLPFGMRDGRLVHISEVERGLKCGCLCPSCSHQLVARKGEQVVHHFAHHKGEDCQKTVETALHLAAKQILEEERKIKLPAVEAVAPWAESGLYYVTDEQTVELEKVEIENRLDGVVPDVLAYAKGVPFMIEITVTHGIDEEKLGKIKKIGISTLEISLEDMDRNFKPEDLRKVLVDSTWEKGWVYSVKYEREKAFLRKHSDRKMVYEGKSKMNIFSFKKGGGHYVRGCPIKARTNKIGKHYAYTYHDCGWCYYHIMPTEEDNGLLCVGKQREKVRHLIKKIRDTFHYSYEGKYEYKGFNVCQL